MLLKEFPDLTWLKKQAEQDFSNGRSWTGATLQQKGWPTVVLNATARDIYRDNIPGPLSFFSNVAGKSTVKAGSREVTIPEDCFFISNAGQPYSLAIDKNSRTETFNIHFGKGTVEDVFANLTRSGDVLLDNPKGFEKTDVGFFTKLYRKDEITTAISKQLRAFGTSVNSMREQELIYELLTHLIKEYQKPTDINSIEASKLSTKKELIKRLHFTTDYIFTNYDQDISLDDLSREGLLSKFHLVRNFKRLFGRSPYQFINQVRIDKAKNLLSTTGMEVREISSVLGFDSPGTFSRLFKNQTGVYPTQFRDHI